MLFEKKRRRAEVEENDRISIAALRKETGLSQEKFSRKYGIPKRTLQNWELYERDPEHKEARQAPPYVYSMLRTIVRGT